MEEIYKFLNGNLMDIDKDVHNIIEFEKRRQERKIILIASESICPKPVLEAQASVFSNIYAEGYPSIRMSRREREEVLDYARFLSFHRRYGDRRHYKGCDYVNFIETLAQYRAAVLFRPYDPELNLELKDIYVNVQPLSGAAANNAVYQAFVNPGDTVMGMALPHGGHLTHGSEFNRSGKMYNVVSYEVDLKTGKLNYDKIRELALKYKPKMIIGGASAYPWDIDWKKLREIADEVSAILLADVSHPSGLIAAGLFPNPVGYAHVSSLTTHKTLCGPRAAILISTDLEIARKLDTAVFPGEQGGPHVNTIAGLAVAFKLAQTDEFKKLMKRVVENAQALANALKEEGLTLAYGGTNTHLCLVDLNKIKTDSGFPLKGDIASNILDLCGITCNKNTIPGDITASDSSAIRLGTTWVSQLGMGPDEMKIIAKLISKVLKNIKTFSIETGKGKRGRGRIAQKIMREVKKEVAKLLKKNYHSSYPLYPHYYHYGDEIKRENLLKDIDKEIEIEKEDLVVFHNHNRGVINIRGERSSLFLSEVTTADIINLKEGDRVRTWILDKDGNIIDDVLIFKIKSKNNNYDEYLLFTNSEKREEIKEWLRDLSDGYVYFDEECIYTKIQGPVVIEDLYENINPLTSICILGKKVEEIIEKLKRNEENIYNTSYDKNISIYEVLIPVENIPKLIENIKNYANKKIKKGDDRIINQIRKKIGLSDIIGKKLNSEIIEKFSNFIEVKISKPYFIGENKVRKSIEIKDNKKEHKFELYKGEPRKTPLYNIHKKLTKKALVPFAGWYMPIVYTSIFEEHNAVRKTAGLFDVTHMGVLEVAGKGSTRFLDLVTTNYVEKLQIGQSHYSYLIDPNGSVIDDIMVYKRDKEKYMVVVNAVNAEKNFEWLKAVLNKEVIIDKDYPEIEIDVKPLLRDLKAEESGEDRKVDIALQGPKSLEIILECIKDNKKLVNKVKKIAKSTFIECEIQGIKVLLSRSGYTGEEWGFELYVHPNDAPNLWNLLLEKGEKFGIKPTGLGARDSTRTEAGFPLYGHELSGEFDITPLEAGYGSFVKYHKPFFIGKRILLEKDMKTKNTIVRFEVKGKGIRAIRPSALVFNKKGEYIGKVTSCTFIGDKQVGMAYIKSKYSKEGNIIHIFTSLPEKTKHKEFSKLKIGDKFPLSEVGKIVSRFPMRGETSDVEEED